MLLLEGDQYQIAPSGVARSLYHLTSEPNFRCDNSVQFPFHGSSTTSFVIEEIFDLKRLRKAFVVREKTNAVGKNETNNFHINKKDLYFNGSNQRISLTLQEIADEGVVNGAGTGSRTWDSSIAMSAYFALHPELMLGNVIEIGSGVGLGGILSFLFRSLSSSAVPFHSMTLSDSTPQVIKYCNENIKAFLQSYPAFSSISVVKLDWYDILNGPRSSFRHAEKYDTVIACDCAYDYTDITALASTLNGLLSRKKTSKAHIFGPSNRGGLCQLLSHLRKERLLFVQVEHITMARYRLKADRNDWDVQSLESLEEVMLSSGRKNMAFHSKSDSEFLHVTCSLRLGSGDTFFEDKPSFRDID